MCILFYIQANFCEFSFFFLLVVVVVVVVVVVAAAAAAAAAIFLFLISGSPTVFVSIIFSFVLDYNMAAYD
jgi:hypothetical protein